ncbi:MAG: DUF488 family protein [Paracoccaceae bacterium]
MASRLATIGYENAALGDVIARLRAASVARVVDVRAVAASRRAGFSKRVLAASLMEAGIGYTHLRALGTPKAGREAARRGRVAEMRAIYADWLATPEAVDAFAALAALARAEPCALLCYEADASGCHRRVLAERLDLPTVDL